MEMHPPNPGSTAIGREVDGPEGGAEGVGEPGPPLMVQGVRLAEDVGHGGVDGVTLGEVLGDAEGGAGVV